MQTIVPELRTEGKEQGGVLAQAVWKKSSVPPHKLLTGICREQEGPPGSLLFSKLSLTGLTLQTLPQLGAQQGGRLGEHSQEQFLTEKSFEKLPSVFEATPQVPALGLVLCSTTPQTLVPALSTHWVLLGLFIPHTAPHPSGRVTALLLRNPPKLPQRPSQALVIYYCKQANEKGLRGCTPPHLHLQLAQHSTVLCPGQSFSKFQSGFVSKSTFHYQHQVHFLALACFITVYTARAISGSNQFLQNPAKQLACSLPQQQPSRLPGAQGASQLVTMSPGTPRAH